MALPSSGTITLAQIQAEFGGVNPASLSEYYRGGIYVSANNTNVPTSGAISLSNFYGAVKQFLFTISGNLTNANLRLLAISAGWDQNIHVVATIAPGVIINSPTTASPAMTVSGSFPGGVVLYNTGVIIGMGGNGGAGNANAGLPGGAALAVSTALTLYNSFGIIVGGGGGGGGGAAGGTGGRLGGGGGGGGGQSNAFPSSGGAGGGAPWYPGAAGSSGTNSGAGAGGSAGYPPYGGAGGAGGNWGSPGSVGVIGVDPTYQTSGAGGAAGAAITGYAYVTLNSAGTIIGPLV